MQHIQGISRHQLQLVSSTIQSLASTGLLWFGAWLVIGLFIYFLYGKKHSKLKVDIDLDK